MAFQDFQQNLFIGELLDEWQTVSYAIGQEFCKGVPVKIVRFVSHLTCSQIFQECLCGKAVFFSNSFKAFL